ncbi:DUF6968 family protein [Sphingopyxis sp. FD7]|uniref:DUF6968 family protein n=1 Tax=Sphingopyxis sp. FD7 TaxID=1914525 RepID=UPI003FA6BBD2
MSIESAPVVDRTFSVDGKRVSCRFFRPELDSGSYFCRYEIDWPEGRRSRSVGGVDEVQALLLAMKTAHTDLLAARENDGRSVLWMGQRSLGLPIANSIRDWDADNPF